MTIREALEKAERAELWDGTGFRRDLMALNYDMKLVITDAGREVLTALRKAEALDALQARMSGGDYGEVQRIVGGVRIHDGDEFALAAATLYELGRKLAEDAKQDCATRLNPDGTMTRMVPSDELEQAQSELATVSAERDEAESDAIGTRDTLRDAQSDLALARRQVQVLACAFSYCRGTEADGCSTCQCAPDWENENEDWERPCDCDPEGLVAWSEQQAREQIAAEEATSDSTADA
jgi:hypothetical protein